MKPALLLIDLQNDFLQRKNLLPRPDRLISKAEHLLREFREMGGAVFHVWTEIRRDGTNRMPHWKRNNTWACVEGTPGGLPPDVLRPMPGESVFTKQYFSAFGNPLLNTTLGASGIELVVVAGIFLHGCVRATVLDAYENGYTVWIVDDAVGSDEPDHAEITRTYLAGRAATFMDTHHLMAQLGRQPSFPSHSFSKESCPVAAIGGKWVKANGHSCVVRRNPSNWDDIHAMVPVGTERDVHEACRQTAEVQGLWRAVPAADRAAMLHSWADVLESRRKELALLLAKEIGKPLRSGYEEMQMAVSFIRGAAGSGMTFDRHVGGQNEATVVRCCPQGVIGIITPWNNPIAIPVGKVAPALAYGNTVVWKPALEAPATAMAVMDSLNEAGGIPGMVNLVFGEERTGRDIIEHPAVNAVSFTGSTEAGHSIAALCTRYHKPLQAELGGNNAAIICGDCEVREASQEIALSAFGFAGQRCTSIQRVIVDRSVLHDFKGAFVRAVEALVVGDPEDLGTIVGPLISRSHYQRIRFLLDQAVRTGADVYCGGTIPRNFPNGCWLTPTVLGRVNLDSPLSQDEIFGPVAVIYEADNLDEAIAINNSVRFGLVAALYTQDESNRRRFIDRIEAGILKIGKGPLLVHPSAPFGGWKVSGIGPPEHGVWDREFYTRPQAIYGWGE